jgi:hypothetical protein
VLTVPELHELGITLHLLLDSDRDNVPDAPAIYFVMPTRANIARICQDFRNQLYSAFYLNFISAINRDRLEELAAASLEASCTSQINQVFDQYLNFISLEDDLFMLWNHNQESLSYYALNRPDARDTDIEAVRDIIVDSLFSVFVTLGSVPVIRCPSGNAAEMVAEALDKKLRENLRDQRNNLFTAEAALTGGQISFQRPLLIILDRNVDLAACFHHTWIYQAMIHDLLDFSLNRVVMKEQLSDAGEAGRTSTKQKVYEIDISNRFWQTHKFSPFPTVAEAVQTELDQYRASEDEVKQLKGAMGLGENASDANISSALLVNTARLTSTMSSLPELMEKKKMLDMHTNVATALLDEIKARRIDFLFEMEEKIMSKSSLDKPLLDILSDPANGNAEDKLRLFLMYFISSAEITDDSLEQYKTVLQEAGADLSALEYLKKWKVISQLTAPATRRTAGSSTTRAMNMFSKLMTTGSQFVMEGVRNLVIGERHLPVTRVVDALMEMKSSTEVEKYRYFDPKLLRAVNSPSATRSRQPFSEAIVFMVGGGTYIEYQNLAEYSKKQPTNKKITFGATDLPNASDFLSQLARLGRASGW